MGVLSDSWVADTALLGLSLLLLLYLYLSHVYGYFRVKGIPHLRPWPLLGHTFMINKAQMDVSSILYNSFPEERFFGYFQFMVPTLLVRDPELIHRITVKDFAHFHDRGFVNIEGDFLQTMNLFGLKGATWRTLRNKLTPTFSSGKLKHMFDQFVLSGDHMLENIDQASAGPLEAKALTVDFSTEVIASTAFGIDFGKENPQSVEFVHYVTNAFKRSSLYFSLIFFVVMFAPRVLRLLDVTVARAGTREYFVNLTKATKKYRQENNVKRNDYFDLLLELQSAEEHEHEHEDGREDSKLAAGGKLLTDEVLTAQSFVFLLAGSDTVSATLSFALYHVAREEAVQRRLRQEVHSCLNKHGGCTYQAVKEMTYMDQVLQETLRLYPPIPVNLRECTLPYQIPGSDIVLKKGDKVALPVAGLHMDPKFYPEPEVFKPERFADNNHKPSQTYMPFGDGPRICIAIRFAIVEMKVCLAKILSKYEVEVDSKTQEPLVFDKGNFGPKAIGGIWINFKKKQ